MRSDRIYAKILIVSLMAFISMLSLPEKASADWVELLPAENIENNLPIQSLKLEIEDAVIMLKLEYKEKLKLPDEIIDKGNETGVLDSISVFFDLDNNLLDTPKFLKGLEREVCLMQTAKVKYENMEWLRLASHFFQVKDHAEGRMGEILFDPRFAKDKNEVYISVDKNFIIIRIPKEYLNIKSGSEIRIGVKYKFNKMIVNNIKL